MSASDVQTVVTSPFSSSFPLPYRVLIITTIGLWAWGSNMQILSWVSIDVQALLTGGQKKNSPHRPIYKLALFMSIWVWLNLLVYWKTEKSTSITLLCYLFVFLFILCPFNILCKHERMRFIRCFQRVMFSGLDSDVYFCDKILADIMTSYAKVFGDLYVTMCILFIYNEGPIGDKYYSYVIAPLFTSIPYFIRFKQCIAVYLHSKDPKNTGREHLFNALKYCSAFPVILFSALQKWYKTDEVAISTEYWITPSTIFNLWIIAVAVNSIYSFYWDVAIDWKLSLFAPPGFKLRQHLRFEKSIYYIAIILNFLLRFTWSLKLSSHLHIINHLEPSVFLMECLEVTRRWIWIFFKFESESAETKDPYIPLQNTSS
ncbi:EXS-domain-containing protein [Gigaspora margarita]|uniref:EXS-domain-containing protein n=1 Tax=Gigaspora margarita TaxID=4874 RepID=A0A8H4ATN7_GIGMA|nr:EXS-domain-containing protein [Gigaspora margarita]